MSPLHCVLNWEVFYIDNTKLWSLRAAWGFRLVIEWGYRHLCPVTGSWERQSCFDVILLAGRHCRPVCNSSADSVMRFRFITGSAVALHCCKAYAKINRKMGNSTPCKIVTSENIILKLCTSRDYVVKVTSKFWFQSVQWGLLPK